jgi:hypothetical protein
MCISTPAAVVLISCSTKTDTTMHPMSPSWAPRRPAWRRLRSLDYRTCLAWAFTAFNTTRVLAFLPLIWAVHQAGDSSQHSLLTWFTWLGANITSALWLYESGGQGINRVLLFSLGNAGMNVLAIAVIVWYRL